MRPDFHKVLVEEPRRGSSLDNWTVRRERCLHRALDADALDALPHGGPMEPRHRLRKHFGEHLGPLRRFLMDRVGRPWDAVYSEIRSRVSSDSTVQMHIFSHLFHYVHLNVVVEGRLVYPSVERSWWRGIDVRYALRDDQHTFYVDPRTGLLCRPKAPRGRGASERWRRGEAPPPGLDLPGGRRVRAFAGEWFEIEVATASVGVYDVLIRAVVGLDNAAERRHLYGRDDLFARAKRQLSRGAIRALGLPPRPPSA